MRRRSDVVWRRAPGFLALSREGRDVTVIHGAAADAWELLSDDTTTNALIETLAARYAAPIDAVRADVVELMDLLVDQGFVEDADAT